MTQEKKKAMYLHYIETKNKLEKRASTVFELIQEVGDLRLEKYDVLVDIEFDIEADIIYYKIEDYEGADECIGYPLQYLWMEDEDVKKDIVKRREERLKKAAEEKAKSEKLRQEEMEKEERNLYEKLKQKYENL